MPGVIRVTEGLLLFAALTCSCTLAGEFLCDFSAEGDGTILSSVARIRRFHPVAASPDVKISMPDPAYRTYKGAPAGFGYFGQLLKLADGTLVASFGERPEDRDHYGAAGSRRVSRYSKDGGETWGEPYAGTGSCVMPDGTVWGKTCRRKEGWVVPVFDPLTGNELKALKIPFEGPFPGVPRLALSNGDVIFEVHDRPGVGVREGYFREGNLGPAMGPKGGAVRSIVISDLELGKWEEVTLTELGYQRDEFWITETATPGELVMLARNQSLSNYYYQAISHDYGRTWDGGRPSGVWFSTQPSRPFVMTLSDGTVLALCGERANGRMIATPSHITGRGWSVSSRIVICDSPTEYFRAADFSYPDAVEVAPGRLLVRYYTSSVRDIMTQWGVWGNFLDTTYVTNPYAGVRLAVDAGEGGRATRGATRGRWSFEDVQEAVANDDIASNYGRVYGGKRVAGRFGKGLELAAGDSEEYVEVVDSPAMRVGNAFAIELFFKADDTSRQQGLVSKRPFTYLGIRDGVLVFEIGDPSRRRSRLFYAVTGKTNLEAGRWYHAAAVTGVHWDGYRKMHLFLDGEPEVDVRGWERTYPPSLSHAPRDAQPRTRAEAMSIIDKRPEFGDTFWNIQRRNEVSDNLLIGADCVTSPADFFGGVVDEVVIHDAYLYPSDVKALAGRRHRRRGTVSSRVIMREEDEKWTRFWADTEVPEGTSISFRVVDHTDRMLVSGLENGADLSRIQAWAIRLQAELWTDDPYRTPVLRRWAIGPTEPEETLQETTGGTRRDGGRDADVDALEKGMVQ